MLRYETAPEIAERIILSKACVKYTVYVSNVVAM